jgi:aminopeptidase-like protein
MHSFASHIFPWCRSVSGPEVRRTLDAIQNLGIEMQVLEVPSGTRCFDWEIPDEWSLREAYVEDPKGDRILDVRHSSLHVVSYSEPVDRRISLEELRQHMHTCPERPDAIPYRTSYYRKTWGFCMSHRQAEALLPGDYTIKIDSQFYPGSISIGEVVLPGQVTDEILLSTYTCHPSMANNEVSGVVTTAFLARWLRSLPNRYYTYRLLFLPETIGSIAYCSLKLDHLKQHVKAGWVVTCVGDERTVSFLPSRLGGTLADRATLHFLQREIGRFDSYSFLERGSDERQYCSPGVDLPVVSLMRSKYGTYPEYHTSDDDLTLVTPSGLGGSFEMYRRIIEALEQNRTYVATCSCEPQLGKRGLYPDLGTGHIDDELIVRMNFLSYCDGSHDLLAVAERCNVPVSRLYKCAEIFRDAGLIRLHK